MTLKLKLKTQYCLKLTLTPFGGINTPSFRSMKKFVNFFFFSNPNYLIAVLKIKFKTKFVKIK